MKSKRTRETDIPSKVKRAVFERDNGECIVCHNLRGRGIPNAHYIRRGQRRTWYRAKRRYAMSGMSSRLR